MNAAPITTAGPAHGITLADLAGRANILHAQITSALRTSLDAAIEIGGLLLDAKAQTGHGAFGRWLADNVKFSDRTARRYMTVFDNRERLLKSDSVSDLSSAYHILAAHAEPDPADLGAAIAEAESEFATFDAVLNDPAATLPEIITVRRRAMEHVAGIEKHMRRGEIKMGEFFNELTPEPGHGYTIECPRHDGNKDLLIVSPASPEDYFWINFLQMGPGKDEGCLLEHTPRPVRRDGVALFAAHLLGEPRLYKKMAKLDSGVMEPSEVDPFALGVSP